MKRLIRLALAALLALGCALPARAEMDGNPGTTPLSVTSTTQSVTFTGARTSLLIKNDDATNEVYYRVFACGETISAATTASGKELKAGETLRAVYNGTSERVGGLPARGYCGFSIICAAAETASVRWLAK